jgi:hypothetical protein
MKICQCQVHAVSQNELLPYSDLCGGDLIVEIARLFIHTPYKAQTLECPGKERLIVNWSAFDCTTFLETVLSLARCIRTKKISHYYFRINLKLIRYRQGKVNGYTSRLHYFADWLRDNEKKKILKDISHQFDAQTQRKKINYMTLNRGSYPALKNEFEFQKMRLVEKNLSRKVFHMINKDNVSRKKTEINNGDVIAFTTKDEGLDVAHTGFAIWQGKNLHLLHASRKEGAVVISKKTLLTYLKSNKNFTGIIIARVL